MAGTSPFTKKNVPDNVRAEIDARAGKSGILWSAKKFPWIHLTSMSSGCDAKYTELSSLKQGDYRGLYEENYVRPLPVITGVDVKKQGELGTTRRVTVKIVAYTDQQLIDLQKCYFIPGMDCRVEWGWSEDVLGNRSLGPIGNRELGEAEAICRIKEREKQQTHYSGIQGIVGNFSYSLTSENYWDCSVEIIAAAEAFGPSKVSDYNCSCPREYEREDPDGKSKKVVENRSVLYTMFIDLFKSYATAERAYRSTLEDVAKQDGKKTTITRYMYEGARRTEKGADDVPWYELDALKDTTEPYISWATLEAAINAKAIPTDENNVYTLGKLTSTKMLLTHHPKLESTDPRVCVIPGTTYETKIAHRPVEQLEYSLDDTPAPAIVEEGGKKYVMLDNIMVNVVMLLVELDSVEKGDGTIASFVTNVLNKINNVCGSLWEFEIISTTGNCITNPADTLTVNTGFGQSVTGTKGEYNEKHPTISIVDAKMYQADKTYSLPALPIGNINDKISVLRGFQLDMKMTDSMKSQALYSNGSQQTTSDTSCGSNAIFAPFGLSGTNKLEKAGERTRPGDRASQEASVIIKNLAKPKAAVPPKCDDCKKASPNSTKQPKEFSDLMKDLNDDVSSSTTTAALSALIKEYGISSREGDNSHCDGTPLPFVFSFTLDGIGGFSFGQTVTCDRIPEDVRKSFVFQVTAVEHSITPNDWTTTVNTVARANFSK